MTIIGKLFVKPVEEDEGLGMLSKLVKEALANNAHAHTVVVDNDYSFGLYREGVVSRISSERRADNVAELEETVTVVAGTTLHLFGSKTNGIFNPLAHRIYFNVLDHSLSIDLKSGIAHRFRYPIPHDTLPPIVTVKFNH